MAQPKRPKRAPDVVWRRFEAPPNTRLLNRVPYLLEVGEPVGDIMPVVSRGGNLLAVDYSEAANGRVSFRFSDSLTLLRAVLYTVKA